MTFGTTVAGNYTIRVSVTDVAGLVSNELTGNFRIAPPAWVLKAPVPKAEFCSFLAAASGGRVYLIGSLGPTPSPDAMLIYDVVTDTWTNGPTRPNAHSSSSVAATVSGVVYVIGGADFANWFVFLKEGKTAAPYATLAAAKEAGAVTMNIGVFLNALINFLVVAFALFMVVKGMNAMKR